MSGVKPITPAQASQRARVEIPSGVISAFNTLIARNFSGGQAVVLQNDAIVQIIANMESDYRAIPVTREQVFESHWLDIEHVFEKAGWIVEYDRPAYNETYPARFIFTKRKV